MEEIKLKRCSKCKEEKLVTEYYKDKRATDGLASQCRICNLAYRQKEPGKFTHIRNMPHEPEGMRWCSKCNEIKPLNQFGIFVRKGTEKYKRECMDCKNKLANQYNEKNRELKREKGREFRKNHVERNRIYMRIGQSKRRAQKLSLPNNFSSDDRVFMMNYFDHSCAVCGNKENNVFVLALDHFIPLSLKSENNPGTVAENIVPLCHVRKGQKGLLGGCNNSKGAKLPHIWLREKFSEEEAQAIEAKIQQYFQIVRDRKKNPNGYLSNIRYA